MLLVIVTIAVFLIFAVWLLNNSYEKNKVEEVVGIDSFQECLEAGYPVMESYPRQYRAGDQMFTEEIGNEFDKSDLIFVDNPRPNQTIKSPLIIKGEARGVWFFEGDFPVVLTDWDGLIIGQGIAVAQGEWMTEEFVPFQTVIEFSTPQYKNNGALILQKDNPSDLPEHDDALEIPIFFDESAEILSLSLEEALSIARENQECSMAGILTDETFYNENSKTWWINLQRMPELEKDGCNPACVVSSETKSAEVNWRCTGAIPDSGNTGILPFDSGVSGVVTIGPSCPVQKQGDESCDDKPYATSVQVIETGSPKSSPFAVVESDKEEKYKALLPPGEYSIQAIGGSPLPFCEWKTVTVEPSTISVINLSCDSGIR